jgi:hypothetical protein
LQFAPSSVRGPLCSVDSTAAAAARVLRPRPVARLWLVVYLVAVHVMVLLHLMLSSRALPAVSGAATTAEQVEETATLKLD